MFGNDSLFSFRRCMYAALIAVLFFVVPAYVGAATLSLSPSSGTYDVGEVLTLAVRVSAERTINAVSGTIELPQGALQVISVDKGTLVDIWLQEPSISSDGTKISFEGLILDGNFVGTERVFSVQAQVLEPVEAQIVFVEGLVLANDGFGTNIAETLERANLSFVGTQNVAQTTTTDDFVSIPGPSAATVAPLGGGVASALNAPIVLDYTYRPPDLNDLRIEGVTYPNANVEIFLQPEGGELEGHTVLSDAGGNYLFAYAVREQTNILLPANVFTSISSLIQPKLYQFWLRAEVNGQESQTTKAFEILVGGFSLQNLFSETASALVVVLIIVITVYALAMLILYGWRMIRRMRKKAEV